MPDFVPVDHQPEFDAEQFVPPFLQDWAKQAAPKDVDIIRQTVGAMTSLPQRAIEASARDLPHLGDFSYEPESIGPALETAMLPMGTGALAGVPMRAGETALGSGMLRARYDRALADGKITPAEHQGFVEALAENTAPTTAGLADKFSGQQRNISDIIRESGLPKEQVHNWLLDEAKAGRVTIHPTTSVDLPQEAMDAGLSIPGFKEPFISAYFKPKPATAKR